MNTGKTEVSGSGEVLPFPSRGSDPDAAHAAAEKAVLEALLEKLRGSETREKLLKAGGGSHENVEAMLRSPHLRGGLAACVQAYLIEKIPEALKLFSDALQGGQSWAFKTLFEVIGFQQMGAGTLEEREDSDVVISSAFERDYVRKALNQLKGKRTNGADAESTKE